MKKSSEYLEVFTDENQAYDRMTIKNKACQNAHNYNDVYVLTEGPEPDTWAVLDINTAIEMDMLYRWAS